MFSGFITISQTPELHSNDYYYSGKNEKDIHPLSFEVLRKLIVGFYFVGVYPGPDPGPNDWTLRPSLNLTRNENWRVSMFPTIQSESRTVPEKLKVHKSVE